MISLKEFMEVVDYRVTEGSDYTWPCFGEGSKPYSLSAWNGDHDGWSFNIVFDTGTQEVYMVESCDYKHQRAYRRINPDWVQAYREHAEEHSPEYVDQAWDDVNYVDLESDDDWIQKALAIISGEDYDTRVSIPLDIPEDELLIFFKAAHERDMTFNEFVEDVLRKALEDFERDPDEFKQRFPTIQSPPFPAENFTAKQARKAVKKAQKALKKQGKK